MTTTYALSALFKITRLDHEGRVVLHAGAGDDRGHFAVDGAGSQPVVAWLLSCTPAAERELAESIAAATNMGAESGREFVRNMIAAKVLVPVGSQAHAHAQVTRWGGFGWRDAADFHLATHGLRFIPDEVDGVSYEDFFARMVDDVESAGKQPAPFLARSGTPLTEAHDGAAVQATVSEVLARAEPINRFDGRRVLRAEFMPALRQAFGVQRSVGGLLGEHHLRSYPSGGARHPFEAYVVSTGLADLPAGVYYYDPVAGHLVAMSPTHRIAREPSEHRPRAGGRRRPRVVRLGGLRPTTTTRESRV